VNHQSDNYTDWLRMLATDPTNKSYARRAAHSGLLAGKDPQRVRIALVKAGVSRDEAKQIVQRQIDLHKLSD